ncbi:necrosis inducing protein-domain-containing protein [Podospora fimiseda]|uniref:Necrosis inducing protein-domain-containing protein n=1 Tax=Podospora fimiseda TaxID=252190 RepID=A0AAN7BGI9_9PEZI|nr:necrosis inducing protein-domain-containing protein [Podospora fimiseda]
MKTSSILLSLAGTAVAVPLAGTNRTLEYSFTTHNQTLGFSPQAIVPLRAVTPPTALPQKATENDLRWQPTLDFDTDGCYNVPAIDAQGNVVQGLTNTWTGLSSDCRDLSDLDNNNVYSRQRCNNGVCVYMYGYYFEKDVAIPYFATGGHRHDWEHIAVWVNSTTNKALFVGASQHGNFEIKAAKDVRWDGEHPKMVYHKDGASTHCFRFGNSGDDKIENHKGIWFKGPLVSYNGFPSTAIRDKLFAHDFGAATIGFKDSTFGSHILKSKHSSITFDENLDVGSPGTP